MKKLAEVGRPIGTQELIFCCDSQEDARLVELVSKHGPCNWSVIAEVGIELLPRTN